MRIRTLEIREMGPHHQAEFTFETSGLHVLYGANEAGKSTLLAAIRGSLFGVPRLSEGQPHLRPGAHAKLLVEQETGELVQVERTLTRRQAPRLTFADGTQATGQNELTRVFLELQQIDQVLFESFFTIQLADLVAFVDKPSALANQLFGVRAPMVNPYLLEESLERRAHELYNPNKRATKPELNALGRQLETLRRELSNSHDRAGWYRQTLHRKNELEARKSELFREMSALEQRDRFWKMCAQVRDTVTEFVETEEQMRALGACPIGTWTEWSKVEELHDTVSLWSQDVEQQRATLDGLAVRREALMDAKPLLDVRNDVTRLLQRIERVRQVLSDWRQATVNREQAESERRKLRTSFPSTWSTGQIERVAKIGALDSDLIQMASNVDNRQHAVREALQNCTIALEWERTQKEACALVGKVDHEDPDGAWAALGRREASLLRSRDDIRTDIDRMQTWLDSESTQDRPSLAPKRYPLLGASAGALFVGASVAEGVQRNWVFAALFFVCAIVFFVWGRAANKPQVQQKGNGHIGFPRLRSSLEHVDSEMDTSAIVAQLERQLRQVEGDLESVVQLKSAVPGWQQAAHQRQLREAECRAAKELLAGEEVLYRSALEAASLGDTLWTSTQLTRISEAAREYLQWQSVEQQADKQERQQRDNWTQLTGEVTSLLEAHRESLDLAEANPLLGILRRPIRDLDVAWDIYGQLHEQELRWSNLLDTAIKQSIEAASVEERIRALQGEIEASERRIQHANQQVLSVFRQLGVEDIESYRAVMKREDRRLSLQRKLDGLRQDLILACMGEQNAATVVKTVKQMSHMAIEAERRQAGDALLKAQSDVSAAQEQLWQTNQELLDSQEDGRGSKLRWELAQVEARVASLEETYAALSLARALSRTARARVEAKHSSPVLTLAGVFLQRMTAGRYTDVRIPFGSEGLQTVYVMDGGKASWTLESLSRGTREQVYLSLRLAVIRHYREQGVILPVVLDDPLVNFDDDRTERVLDVLREEAREQPILYLTCHRRFLDQLPVGSEVRMIVMGNESGELV
ncbi:AAA family ATPase [Alicyclobacillus dauci]|uniref:AAA family ATPase n=1 Tax=Alicyclobacillus dauci TaxID=1475485 RepID=A0ABY6Z879_9BACL|nr:AAA family ATPase [Alicyclobacillus dauci]WAH38466.1 AAA family ATPase [Alicyclobacillus dauci]